MPGKPADYHYSCYFRLWNGQNILVLTGIRSFSASYPLKYHRKECAQIFKLAEQYAADLKVYYQMLKHLEKYSFKASYLQEIKKGIRDSQGREVYKQIERLSVLIAPITSRRNAFYAFNIVALRDFHYMIALEKWKQQSGQALGEWFDALAEMEVLASLAVIRLKTRIGSCRSVFAAQEAQANETNKAVFWWLWH